MIFGNTINEDSSHIILKTRYSKKTAWKFSSSSPLSQEHYCIADSFSLLELLSLPSSLFFSFIQWLIFKCLLCVRHYSWCWVHSSKQTGKVQVLIHWCFTGEGQTINILRGKTIIIWEEQVRMSRERVTRCGSTLPRKVREGLSDKVTVWWKLGHMREKGMWVTGQREEQYARGTCVPGTDRRPVWLKEVSHQKNQGPDTWGQGMDFGFYSQSDGKTFGGFWIEKWHDLLKRISLVFL